MKANASQRALEELGWEYVARQIDAIVARGLERLPPAGEPVPAELHLELTHRCDLKCVMCEHWQVEHLDPAAPGRELDFPAIKRFVEKSSLLRGVKTVVITGGEPWLRHDLSDILVWLAGALPSAEIIVLTNLWNTGHLRTRLRELRERGLAPGGAWRIKIGSSLDGLDATHDAVRGQPGAFAGLARSVTALRREFPGLGFGFTFTLLPRNAGELHLAYHFVRREFGSGLGAQWAIETPGVDPIVWDAESRAKALAGIRAIARDICVQHDAVVRMSPETRAAHHGLWADLAYWRYLEEYGREERRFPFFLRCTAGERHVMVGAEGEVFFCPKNRARTIGSVKEQGIDAMWKGPRAEEERRYVASGRCHCWLRCVSAPALERLLTLGLEAPAK